jgi:hypothetical protein
MAPSPPPRAISTPEGSSGAMAITVVRVDAQVREQVGEDPALQLDGQRGAAAAVISQALLGGDPS